MFTILAFFFKFDTSVADLASGALERVERGLAKRVKRDIKATGEEQRTLILRRRQPSQALEVRGGRVVAGTIMGGVCGYVRVRREIKKG